MKILENIMYVINNPQEVSCEEKLKTIEFLISENTTRYQGAQRITTEFVESLQTDNSTDINVDEFVTRRIIHNLIDELDYEELMDKFSVKKVDPEEKDIWSDKWIDRQLLSELKRYGQVEYQMDIRI